MRELFGVLHDLRRTEDDDSVVHVRTSGIGRCREKEDDRGECHPAHGYNGYRKTLVKSHQRNGLKSRDNGCRNSRIYRG